MDIFRRFAKEGAREIVYELLRAWIWPTVFTLVPTVLLAAQGLPLGYIAIGGLAAFAFSVWGVFGFSRWRYYRDPEWKLSFSGGLCSFNEQAPADSPTKQICLGFSLGSTAEFPIVFHVEEMTTSMGSYFNPEPIRDFQEIVVPAMGVGFQYNNFIDVPASEITNGIAGRISFRLKYGREGAMIYELKKTQQCHIYTDNNGQAKFMFNDLNED